MQVAAECRRGALLDRPTRGPQGQVRQDQRCAVRSCECGGLNNSGNDPSGAGNSAKTSDPRHSHAGHQRGRDSGKFWTCRGQCAALGLRDRGTAGNRAGGTSSGKIDGTVTSGGPDRPGDAEMRSEDDKVDQKIKSICKGC